MTNNSRDNAQGQPIDEVGESIGLLEGIRTTRAIRRLKPDPVPIELVKKVCEAGTFAPSGGNRQPWMFVAVTDPEKRAQIATLYREVFDAYIAPAVEAARDPGYPEAKRKTCEPRCTWLRIFMKRPYTYLLRAGPAEALLKVRRFFLPFRMCCSLVERWVSALR